MSRKRERLFDSVEILSGEDLERINDATLQVLDQVGILFEDSKAREILKKSGATVDKEIVKFPAELVNESIKAAPQEVILGARNTKKSIKLGKEQILFTNGFGATQVIDLETKEYRKATVRDLRDFTIVCDFLDNINYCLYEVFPQDIPPHLLDLAQAFTLLSNTSKHVQLSTQDANYIDEVIALGEIVSNRGSIQDPSVYSLGCCPLSPLRYPKDTTVVLRKAVKQNIPFLIVSGAVSGASAPVTLAGSLVVQNAEVLAGITLAQAISPGAPVVYGSFASPMDMRSGKQLLGIPELSLMNLATAQLCKYYQIPFGYGTGGVADSFVSGVQAGFEKSFTTLLGVLGGVEVIHDAVSGLLGSAMVASYEQLILDNEFCEMIRHYLKGIEINDKTLALDAIKEVGPGGDFLRSKHTVQNFREQLYLSELWDRGRASSSSERERVLEKAAKKVKEILSSHQPVPLSADKVREMKAILEKAGLGNSFFEKLNCDQGNRK